MNEKVIHESFFGVDKRAQTYGVESIVEVEGDTHVVGSVLPAVKKDQSFKIKLSIDIDSSYPRQSRISSSVWTPLGWREVVTIDGSDPSLPKTDIGYVPDERLGEKYVVIAAICDRLLSATLKVVA